MKKRGDTEKEINKRLETAKKEIPAWKEYDYVVINDILEEAKNKIKCIIISNRQKTDKFDFSLIKDERLKKLMLG
jgi:guanylate kinase